MAVLFLLKLINSKIKINLIKFRSKDLDTSTTSVCYVEKKNILDLEFFISKIKHIELETKCLINLHGVENQNGIVWIRIKNQCSDLRKFAILLINSYTHNSIKEVSK